MGPDPTVGRGRARRSHRARQRVGVADHGRQGARPRDARRVGLLTLPRGIPVCRCRRRRVEHRPLVGRPDHGLGERVAAGRGRALPVGAATVGRRRAPREVAAGADASGDVRRQPAHSRRAGRGVPRGDLPVGSAAGRSRAASGSRPLSVRAGRRGPIGAGLFRGVFDPGVGARAAAALDRPTDGGHRGVGWARLDPRADRRVPGDGPVGAAPLGRAGLHHAGVRDLGSHEGQRDPADGVARGHLGGARHPAGGHPVAPRSRAPGGARRGGL